MPEVPKRMTRATLVGPLCRGTACRCGDTAAAAGAPTEAGVKRYEIVLGPTDNELWATVDDMTLYKSPERATECFYVDLAAPGDHPVTLRAQGDAGFGAALTIHELAATPAARYDTFEFSCGAPGACRADQLDEFRASLGRYKGGIHDPCGSTRVQALSWDSDRAPDRNVQGNLYLKLRLRPYKFPPKHPPGDPSCKDTFE